MKFCPNCNIEIVDTAKYCLECGSNLAQLYLMEDFKTIFSFLYQDKDFEADIYLILNDAFIIDEVIIIINETHYAAGWVPGFAVRDSYQDHFKTLKVSIYDGFSDGISTDELLANKKVLHLGRIREYENQD